MVTDIRNINDIKIFVDSFYSRIQEDELLAKVFAIRIMDEAWPKHLERMYSFWNTVLFFERSYKGNPFAKHVGLPISGQHFAQWVFLFKTTIDENFKGPKADEVKIRADKMAELFKLKLQHLNDNPNYKSIM